MRYTAIFRGYGNPDRGENPYKAVSKPYKVTADTIQELQNASQEYIEKYNLGSSNFYDPFVMESSKIVGFISYNGRFWDAESEYCKELMGIRGVL